MSLQLSLVAVGPMGPIHTAELGVKPAQKQRLGRLPNAAQNSMSNSLQTQIDTKIPMSEVAQIASDPDLQCVRAVLAGNRAAFEPLVEAHQQRVYYLTLRMLGDPAAAQDATQDVFLQAYTRLASYKPEWKFKTWLMGIASNLCIDRLRRRKIEPMAFSERLTANPDSDAIDFIEQIESAEPLPEQSAEIHEQQHLVLRMLNTLPAEERSMIIMHYWGDMSYDEIAAASHTSVSAVKSRLFRARRTLAESSLAQKLEVTYE